MQHRTTARRAKPRQTETRTTQTTPLLPLGAMMTAFALAPWSADAQTTTPEKERELPSVTVTDQRDRESTGYNPGTSNIGKVPQALRDIPSSVTVVAEQLMVERNADTLKEALRNVAGLTFNAGEGGRIGDNFTLRGYSVVGDLYLDGIRDLAQYNRETFNLEEVDVLRGSASMIFGRGSTGGVINQVSKRPFLANANELKLTYGSFGYTTASADLNRKLGDTTALRVNLMKTDGGTFRDGVKLDRTGFAPSISWGLGTDDAFTLAHYHLEYTDTPDYGVPWFQNEPLKVPRQRFYGIANFDYQHDRADISTLTWERRIDSSQRLKTVVRLGDYERNLWAVAPRLATGTTTVSDATVLNRQAQRRGGSERAATLQSDYTNAFATGSVKHELLAGIEVIRERVNRWGISAPSALNPSTTVGNTNPVVTLPGSYPGTVTQVNPNNFGGNTTGLYVQDFMTLAPQWKLLAGARHDNFQAQYKTLNSTSGVLAERARQDKQWSLRSGLLYQPTQTSSYYVSFGTGFVPSADTYSLDAPGTNTPPEKTRNIELGAKWDLLNGELMFRTAVFRSEKTNERNTDLDNPTVYLLSGKRHTSGVEFETAGRLTPRWEIFGALALMTARIDQAAPTDRNGTTIEGNRPGNTPRYSASVWTTYRLDGALTNWKLGGGIEAVAKRTPPDNYTATAPAYVRLDAMLEYQWQAINLRLNVLNLTDRLYYESLYRGHVIAGTSRAVQLTVSTKF